MSNDLEIIKRLEEKIGEKLIRYKVFSEFEQDWSCSGYYADIQTECLLQIIDNTHRTIALRLYNLDLDQILPEVFELKYLQYLDMTLNKITSIPDDIEDLNNLEILDLSENLLTSIPDNIGNLKNLQLLNLGDNILSTLPDSLYELNNLKEIDLYCNELISISEKICRLKIIKCIDLGNNNIKYIPKEILELNLEIKIEADDQDGIFLDKNPLESPPIEIIKRGQKAIKAYFDYLEKAKEKKEEILPLNEIKVFLVGDGGAGKTSLVKQILGEEYDPEEPSTHEIEKKKWNIEDTTKRIKVNLWDFGGQVIMHATHQCFLSKRSLYIFVVEARMDTRSKETLEYWLKLIESFGGSSPILIVINKIDQNSSFKLNYKGLLEKYKNIVGFFKTSCSEPEGIEELSRALKEELFKVEMVNTKLAKSWFSVKDHLEEMPEDFIP
ncbi:GTP-binding protein [bacterium]|nr:GTP-binding protein [bacterium]